MAAHINSQEGRGAATTSCRTSGQEAQAAHSHGALEDLYPVLLTNTSLTDIYEPYSAKWSL